MAVVFTILKVVLALLGLAAVLLAVALLLPLGFSVAYRRGRVRIQAVYGPLHRTLWSFRVRRPAARPIREKAQPPQPPAPPAAGPAPAQSPPETAASPPAAAPDTPQASPPEEETPAGEEENAQIPAGAAGRLEQVLTLLEEDPRALLQCAWAHMRWLDRHSFFKVWVRHLNVFWTVTCEDAAQTAIVYGAALPALNALLAAARQKLHLQSDRLWLEPDFTGQRREEREISFTVSARAVLMLHLLYRIWKDPLLQPKAQQTTV